MTKIEMLLKEYRQWLSCTKKAPSDEALLTFLDKRQALHSLSDMPGWIGYQDTPRFVLLVRLNTDGDFSCKADIPNLAYDGDEGYLLTEYWPGLAADIAKKDAVQTLHAIKNGIYTSRSWLQHDLANMLDKAIAGIEACGACAYVKERIGGNYEGTEVLFALLTKEEES